MNRAILFDCDSTLSTIEGIDVLAEQAGVVDQVVPLTNAAMDGRLKLEDAYAARLDLIRPDAAAIEALGQRYIDTRVNGACKAVAALRALGWQVHVVSGGIRQAVLALARHLGVPDERVHAVDLLFDANGAYAGFDRIRRWRAAAARPKCAGWCWPAWTASSWSATASPILKQAMPARP
jgi:phosphoserine phosphatase